MDKSLNRGMLNKFESRKICVAGYQCDNSDFDFCIAEHSELPVIKICSDEGRDDCQQLKPKGTEASFGTTVITATILFIISILFSRVTINVLVFVLHVVFFHTINHKIEIVIRNTRCFQNLHKSAAAKEFLGYKRFKILYLQSGIAFTCCAISFKTIDRF